MIPAMSNLSSSTLLTSGLVNSTLYDTFTRNQNVTSASVNASTIRANCGLLPISSSDRTADVNAILSGVGNITNFGMNLCELQIKIYCIGLTYRTGKDEIVMLNRPGYCTTTNTSINCPLFFMLTTAMELDSSIDTSSVSINGAWQYTPMDGQNVTLTHMTYFAHIICIQVEKFKPLTHLLTPWPVHLMH